MYLTWPLNICSSQPKLTFMWSDVVRQGAASWRNPSILLLPRIHLFWWWLLHPKQWAGESRFYLTWLTRALFIILEEYATTCNNQIFCNQSCYFQWQLQEIFGGIICFLTLFMPHGRLPWKPPLATATLHSGSLFNPQEQSWNGWGTLWPIDWLLLARSGQRSSASTTVERESTEHMLESVLFCLSF